MEKITCAILSNYPSVHTVRFSEEDPVFLSVMDRLREAIAALREKADSVHILVSPAAGTMLCAAEYILGLKSEDDGISLECVIPYEEVAKDWNEPMRERYFAVMEHCDEETLIDYEQEYDTDMRTARYMIDNADCLLVVHKGAREDAILAAIGSSVMQGKNCEILRA
ncbi:MAG: DUF1273 domain-containing protein [Clostridia bacterium]|nr:DUF1273 domain-containing protein [Clostridia bacterium]